MASETAVTMVRIYITEADHGRRGTLMEQVLARLRERHVRGVTVFRGIVGIGETGERHAADLLR